MPSTDPNHPKEDSLRKLLAISLLAALIGCAGTNFNWEDAARVHDGMNEAEVVAILGPPYQRVQAPGLTVVTWSFASGFGGAKAVSYRLVNGKVAGTTTLNSP